MKTPIDEIISEASRLGVGIALAPDGHLEVFHSQPLKPTNRKEKTA
jgi:hypothetical protein